MSEDQRGPKAWSRRGFLGLAGAAATVPLLAACNISGDRGGGGGVGASDPP
jgi:multiple sugar transport system substrate-binding protein